MTSPFQVHERTVEEDGLVAVLATPAEHRPGRSVLVLGGSDGGIPIGFTRLFAAHGFATLGLAYFRGPGLPRTLVEVPLEYVQRALAWFRRQPETAGARVSVVGVSRGTELALLSATRFQADVSGVVALTPASVCFAGLGVGLTPSRRSAWSHLGEPVPFVPFPRLAVPRISRRGWRVGSIYEAALRNEDAVRRAELPVEQIGGPVLLVSGDADAMWPASAMCRMLVERFALHGRADHVTHLHYQHAGHLLSRDARTYADASPIMRFVDFGGTPEGDAAAGDDAVPKILDFLERAPR